MPEVIVGTNTAAVEPSAFPPYLSSKYDASCIITGSLDKFVALPKYLDRNEWLASHAYEFFHLINAHFGTISSSCTIESCPIMRLRARNHLIPLIWPPEFIATSKEGHSSRSSATTLFFSSSNTLCREMCASSYIDSALTWIESQLENPEKFPKSVRKEYPQDFEKNVIVPVFVLLYYILAHIYESHFEPIVELVEEAHLNAIMCHFMRFTKEFGLLAGVETSPLDELWQKLFPPPKMTESKSANLSIRKLSEENAPEPNTSKDEGLQPS